MGIIFKTPKRGKTHRSSENQGRSLEGWWWPIRLRFHKGRTRLREFKLQLYSSGQEHPIHERERVLGKAAVEAHSSPQGLSDRSKGLRASGPGRIKQGARAQSCQRPPHSGPVYMGHCANSGVRWESRGNIYTFKFKPSLLSERKS